MNPTNRAPLPVLPLRDIVMFPMATLPLMVGRPKSLKACEEAQHGDGRILLVAQKESSTENPAADDLYHVGTVAILLKHLVLPDGKLALLVQGERRATISCIGERSAFLTCIAQPIDADEEPHPPQSDFTDLFSGKAWPFEMPPESRAPIGSHVAELQKLLEDHGLTQIERLRRAGEIIRGQ